LQLEGQGRRAVIADGDRAVLELLQIRLDLAGYHTFLARTGPATLDMVRQVRPAVLLLDLDLPQLDGLGVLRQLNPRRAALPFPVLLMGARLEADVIREAAALGVKACLAKPFSGAEVVERVARLFRKPSPPVAAPRPSALV